MKNRIVQAYKQAPWRIQLQWIGLFLLALILVASVTGIYLSVSAKAAATGRSIQSYERRTTNINNEIAVLTTKHARINAGRNMHARAEELGFQLMDPKEAVYLEIPGYDPGARLVLASPRVSMITESPIIRSAYRISLWDWLTKQIWQPNSEVSIPEEEPAQ